MVRFNNHSWSPPPLVPAEPQGQCAGYARGQVLWNYFHPDSSRLKVAGRRFDHHGRCKTLLFHSKHSVPCQIIDQAQVMLPGGPDINVPTGCSTGGTRGNRRASAGPTCAEASQLACRRSRAGTDLLRRVLNSCQGAGGRDLSARLRPSTRGRC